tara:strand:- start:830 stop:1660 length:831 start_codon:yes stop_codon:yes gene_type:complete
MLLDYKNLRNKYLKYFDNDEHYCDFVLADVVFGFSEVSDFLKKRNVSSVLEIGSGTGILLNELKENFPDIQFSGIDPNVSGFHNLKTIISKLNEDGYNIKVESTGVEKYSSDKKFDLIFSINVFEHVEDQIQYLLKTHELLNKNGLNVILCPNYDFPYEPHFVIPIIINKKITKFIFNSKIENFEKKENEHGLWDGLSFLGRKKIEKILKNHNYTYFLDDTIKARMLNRLNSDRAFKKRQGIAGTLAKILRFLMIDKLIFNILRVPFPYMKLIIKK